LCTCEDRYFVHGQFSNHEEVNNWSLVRGIPSQIK
jgi:hypothetical protein